MFEKSKWSVFGIERNEEILNVFDKYVSCVRDSVLIPWFCFSPMKSEIHTHSEKKCMLLNSVLLGIWRIDFWIYNNQTLTDSHMWRICDPTSFQCCFGIYIYVLSLMRMRWFIFYKVFSFIIFKSINFWEITYGNWIFVAIRLLVTILMV